MTGWVLRERFDTNGGQLAWDRFGSGPPVVLVHGTPWSSWSWRRLAPRLAERFTVHVSDLLGFGSSDQRPGQDLSLAAHGERLADLLAFWGLDAPAVVAHDIGGAITLRAHLLLGRGVASLALLDIVATRPWGSPFYRLVGRHLAVFEQLPAVIHRGVVRAYIPTAQPRPVAPDVLDALSAPWLGDAGQSSFYRQIAAGDERDTDAIEPLFGQITAPTLIVWGEEDRWLGLDKAHALAERIPGARLEIVPGAGHLIQEDAPDRLAELVEAHLDLSG